MLIDTTIIKRFAGVRDRLASFADQGLQGLANLIVSIVLARSLSKVEFASIGLMLGVYYFILGLHRANVVLPFILDGNKEEIGPAVQDRWWSFNLLFIVCTTAFLALFAGAAVAAERMRTGLEWVANGLIFSVAVTPALLMTEFARRWLYQARRPTTAAVASFIFFVINVGVAALVHVGHGGAMFGVLSWIVAAAGFVLIAASSVKPKPVSWRSSVHVWTNHRQFATWQSMTHLPYTLYNNSVVILIAFFGGVASAAAFTVARSLNSPINSVVSAVDLLDKPRAVRSLAGAGIAGLRNSINRTRRLLILVNGSYVLLLVLFTPQIMLLVFGERYVQYALEVRLLAVAFFLTCLNQPSETLLIVLRESKIMFAIRLSVAIAVIVAMGVASHYFGSVGCISALVGAQLLNLSELWLAEHWSAKRWRLSNDAV